MEKFERRCPICMGEGKLVFETPETFKEIMNQNKEWQEGYFARYDKKNLDQLNFFILNHYLKDVDLHNRLSQIFSKLGFKGEYLNALTNMVVTEVGLWEETKNKRPKKAREWEKAVGERQKLIMKGWKDESERKKNESKEERDSTGE